MKYQDILENKVQCLKDSKEPIAIFGAGILGKCMLRAADFLGKEVVCFCDNNKQKQGATLAGKEVLSPEEAYRKYGNLEIHLGLGNPKNIHAVRMQLTGLGFDKIENKEPLYYVYQMDVLKRKISRQEFARTLEVLDNGEKYLNLYAVGIVTTQVCTLKCSNCSLLIPHFKNPKHYPKEEIIRSIKNLAAAVDSIQVLTLLGGESLLHPDIVEICRETAKIGNIDRVHILTNGTILPKKNLLLELKPELTYMQINDYGALSTKKQALADMCEEISMECDIYPETTVWYPVVLPRSEARTEEEGQHIYDICPWKNEFMEMQNGKFHICGYSAAGTELCSIGGQDFVDCLDEMMSVEERRDKIKKLVQGNRAVEACKYCGIDFCNTTERANQK